MFRRYEQVKYLHEFIVESRGPGIQHRLPRNTFDAALGDCPLMLPKNEMTATLGDLASSSAPGAPKNRRACHDIV
jgi:hypothetical protein